MVFVLREVKRESLGYTVLFGRFGGMFGNDFISVEEVGFSRGGKSRKGCRSTWKVVWVRGERNIAITEGSF